MRWPALPDDLPALLVAERTVAFQIRTYRPGELLVGLEPADEHVFLLLDGTVRLFQRGAHGREVTVDLVGPGWLLGITRLFGTREELLAEAVSPVRVAVARREALQRVLARRPELKLGLVLALARRLIAVEQRLEQWAAADAHDRLLATLRRLAGEVEADPARDDQPRSVTVRHADLARQIGTARETVTRLLRRLEEEGHIRRERHRITLLNAPRLALSADIARDGSTPHRPRGARRP